ncbi:hypothetical protein ACBI99_36720 [Nonomuraea sp. ATR24]|uniref:hypothetical protein n=1 Tax=Nonomuraea sp. ATR24 TaxID=1676744 RepID=UPI0035BFE6BB
MAAAAVVSVVSGDHRAVSVAATGLPWPPVPREFRLPLLLGSCGVNAWMLWQILRGPALPTAAQPPAGVVWPRRLLYVGVAGDLVLWELLDELPGPVDHVASGAVWTATAILLVRVMRGVSPGFRVAAVTLGLAGALAPPLWLLLDAADARPAGLAAAGCCVAMILAGQRRDGRWSGLTVGIGWVALLFWPVSHLSALALPGGELLFHYPWLGSIPLGACHTVWLARTAHELAAPTVGSAPGITTGRVPRLFAATVLALPLVVVGAEAGARYGFTGPGAGCRERIGPYAGSPGR